MENIIREYAQISLNNHILTAHNDELLEKIKVLEDETKYVSVDKLKKLLYLNLGKDYVFVNDKVKNELIALLDNE